MADIAKRLRIRKRHELGNLSIQARLENSLDWQADKLRQQSAYLENFENEIKLHFYSVKHHYSPEYRELIETQLNKIADVRDELNDVREHIKTMKIKAKAGEF